MIARMTAVQTPQAIAPLAQVLRPILFQMQTKNRQQKQK